MTYRSPNPPAPQQERYSSSIPYEISRFPQWAPIIVWVSYYSEDIQVLAEILTKPPTNRSHNTLFALLRYQLSWLPRTLHRLYPK